MLTRIVDGLETVFGNLGGYNMATTTFSGPILAGTIKNKLVLTGTTVGTDMKNTGQVVTQSFAIDLSGGAIAAEASNVIIPQTLQIIDCMF